MARDVEHVEGTDDDVKSLSRVGDTQDVVLPEIVETLRQEGGRVDINVLLVNLANKIEDPDEIAEQSEKILELARKFESHRVSNFQRMADAIIDVKERDPDEKEKRRNNRARRALKGVVGSCALTGTIGAVVSIALGGGIVVTGLLVSVAAVGLAMSGPLASGESMSSNDAVRIVHAVGKALGSPSDKPEDSKSRSAPDSRAKRRGRKK